MARRWPSPLTSCIPGCSGLGYRAIRCKGLFTGLLILRRRLLRCGAVHHQAHPHSDGPYRPYRRPPVAQRGDCDLPCVVTSGGASLDLADATCACVDCWSWCDSPKDKSKDKHHRAGPPWLTSLF